MQYETLIVERRGGVAHLTLNRPDAANGINLRMGEELLHATTALADDPTVRAVLLTGAGARFCGGGDVKGFATLGDGLGHHIREITVPLHAALSHLVRLDAPVVVAVQGSAAGAGLGSWSRPTWCWRRRRRSSSWPTPGSGSSPTAAPPGTCPGSWG